MGISYGNEEEEGGGGKGGKKRREEQEGKERKDGDEKRKKEEGRGGTGGEDRERRGRGERRKNGDREENGEGRYRRKVWDEGEKQKEVRLELLATQHMCHTNLSDVKFAAEVMTSSSPCTMTGILRQPGDLRTRASSFMVSCRTLGGHMSILVTTTNTGTLRARASPRCSGRPREEKRMTSLLVHQK